MRVLAPTDENIRRAAAALRVGACVGMPTETVYGLAAHAFEPEAILSVFRTKARPAFDPLIAHVTDHTLEALDAAGVLDRARLAPSAAAAFERLAPCWPGPLTLVLPKGPRIPDLATSGLDTVAVRAPAHPVARALIDALGAPVVAPSANRFGHISPTTAADVVEELEAHEALATNSAAPELFVLDGGPCAHGVESTIVGIEDDGRVRLLRPGATPREALEARLGAPLLPPASASAPSAPGMLASHYAPRKPLVLAPADGPPGRPAFLSWDGDGVDALTARYGAPAASAILAPSGDAVDAARNLFAMLRALDRSEADFLVAEPCPLEAGLGLAIRDRLRRAAATR
ncbi:MAG: threonylcarbamoyl-AMP synthase [Myxococcales bacterium]|nr:threonylcarbamoyl-AMP synthase [Myxococcales bacterium]